ncbi:MAG: hypothetical protein QOE92_1432, partial [Chloroflexota bacterium]|nr:hypothetical protein [Chloroflexota bacterium]
MLAGTRGPAAARPGLSVVIVNWNARDALVECLGSLTAHPPTVPIEVILVDNAST